MCGDTGAVVAVSYTAGRRPALARAVLFLASGETLWLGGPLGRAGGGARETLSVRERGAAQYDLRLSARATLLAGPARLAEGEGAGGPPVPVGLELTLEPASQRLALGAGDVTLMRGDGSLSVGSVVHSVAGTAWSASGADGGPGGLAGSRARAVFQDGSALYVAGASAVAGGGGPVAAIVLNTQIRATTVGDLVAEEAGQGRAGRSVSWAAAGRAPAAARGQIRDPRQQVTVAPAGTGHPNTGHPNTGHPNTGRPSWNYAPYVFVRSGVTGLGLVEWQQRESAGPGTDPADELPDPY